MSESAENPTKPTAETLVVKATHVKRDWKHSAPLLGCRYDPTGRYVFASSMDQTIQRWDLEKDQHATFAGHNSWLRGIGFSPDGSTMYSAGYEGRLCFWDATAQMENEKSVSPSRKIEAHSGWIRWLSVHPSGNLVATAGNDLEIKSHSVIVSIA